MNVQSTLPLKLSELLKVSVLCPLFVHQYHWWIWTKVLKGVLFHVICNGTNNNGAEYILKLDWAF